MEVVNGIFDLRPDNLATLKQKAFFFDGFYMFGELENFFLGLGPRAANLDADFYFLREKGLILDKPAGTLPLLQNEDEVNKSIEEESALLRDGSTPIQEQIMHGLTAFALSKRLDLRNTAAAITALGTNTIPIYERTVLDNIISRKEGRTVTTDVMQIALAQMPVPDIDTPWDNIMWFKAEHADELWDLRNFLKDLSTRKDFTPDDVDDRIKWTVNQYQKFMEVHKIKSSYSFIDVFLVAPIELLEDAVKFRITKLAKTVLEVRKRKAELLEAELTAPGRECAYIFNAQQEFGS
jgi:hypothetical protein